MTQTHNDKIEDNYSIKKLLYMHFVEKGGVHFFYIILILVGIIVYLTSANFAENAQVVAYVSFAATISSLILAVFAIFYAVHSNSDLTKSFSDIKGTATTINSSAKDIESASDALLVITRDLNSKFNDISNDVKVIPQSLNQGFDKIGAILYNQRQSSVESAESITSKGSVDTDLKEAVLNGSMLPCKITLLVMYLSFKNGVALNDENLKSLGLATSLDFVYMIFCIYLQFGVLMIEKADRKEIKLTYFDEGFFKLLFKETISELNEFVNREDLKVIKNQLLFSYIYFNVDIPDELRDL